MLTASQTHCGSTESVCCCILPTVWCIKIISALLACDKKVSGYSPGEAEDQGCLYASCYIITFIDDCKYNTSELCHATGKICRLAFLSQ